MTKVAILAGGHGTRLAEETEIKPKPMVEIVDKPILWHIMKIYSAHGINEFIICREPEDYLLFFGRIHPEKGTNEAIEIAKKTKRKLIISGLIQDKKYFNKKVQPYINNDDIVYVGNSGPKDRLTLLSQACALLHPIGFPEPFGLSVVEAMACGTPVVASGIPVLKEVAEEAALFFEPDDVEKMSDALGAILTDNKLRGILIKRGRQRAQQFSWEESARRTLRLLEDI